MIQLPIPEHDGVEHINTWTKGRTRLGRLLTNMADVKTEHPEYGVFRTAEGLYYYLKSGMTDENLRAFDGFAAKEYGRTLKTVFNDKLWEDMRIGIANKVANNSELLDLVNESSLAFEHYYVYHGRVVVPRGSDKFIEVLERVRSDLFVS